MAVRKLQLAGQMENPGFEAPVQAIDENSCLRECLLCYEGTHESMDGEVVVTGQQLDHIAVNYNSVLARSSHQNNGKPHDKHCAPVQIDHSESATLTVGRLRNALRTGLHTLLSGQVVKGLFGPITILGRENVEKSNDGRWSTVSLSADFDAGIIEELTITAFPAAKEASLLSKKNIGATMKTKRLKRCVKQLMSTVGLSEVDATANYEKMSEVQKLHFYRLLEPKDKDAEDDEKKLSEKQPPKDEAKKDDKSEVATDKAEPKKDDKKPEGEKELAGKGDDAQDLAAKNLAKKAMQHLGKMLMEGFGDDKEDAKPVEDEAAKGLAGGKEDKKENLGGDAKPGDENKDGKPEETADLGKEVPKEGSEQPGTADAPAATDAAPAPAATEGAQPGAGAMPDNVRTRYMKMLMEAETLDEGGAAMRCARMLDPEIVEAIRIHEEKKHSEADSMGAKPGEEKEEGEGGPGKKVNDQENPKDHLEGKDDPNKKDLNEGEDKKSKVKSLMANLGKKKETLSKRLRVERLKSRFSRLKASAKITPAEIKGIDFEKLADMKPEDADTVLKMYEGREPVIFVGLQGTSKAVNLAKIVSEQKIAELREETVNDMPFTKKALSAKRVTDKNTLTVQSFDSKSLLDERAALEKLLDSGKVEEAKRLMKKRYTDLEDLSMAADESSDQDDARIAGLEKELSDLSDSLSEITALL